MDRDAGSRNDYGYEDASPDIASKHSAPIYSQHNGGPKKYAPPISRPDPMGERRSSCHFGGDTTINLGDLEDPAINHISEGPRRATMSFGGPLEAPPTFISSGGSNDASSNDFLNSLISPTFSQDPHIPRRGSLQEAVANLSLASVTEDASRLQEPRRNSLQQALARKSTSPARYNNSGHAGSHQESHRSLIQQAMEMDRQRTVHNQTPPRNQGKTRRSSLQQALAGNTSQNYHSGKQQQQQRYHDSNSGYHASVGYTGHQGHHHHNDGGSPIYIVKLKRNQRNFVVGPRIKSKPPIGSYVKVEADRGEDLGIVISEASPDQTDATKRGGYVGGRENSRDRPKKILRLATREEVSLLAIRRQEEYEMHQLCCQKVSERGLSMRIVDAEYQFDRNKLTFYFEAERRVDFRDLVRELFMICGTRIWMCQINTYATSNFARPVPDSYDEEDISEPIIAPTSEFLG